MSASRYDDPLTLLRVVDTETTGLEMPFEMVELGWTDVRKYHNGWAIESGPHSTLVNPGMAISFGAMATHHIRDEEAAAGISPEDARKIATTGADVLVAHSSQYDSQLINGHQLPWICTYKCAKTFMPELETYGNNAIRYELGLCMSAEDHAKTIPSHRAGPDTWVTAHILLELLKLATIEQMIEVSRNPLRLLRINFGEHTGKSFSEIPYSYLDWIVNKSTMGTDPKKEDVYYTARMELQKRRDS